MRLACEIILIVGLLALGWQKSFKQWTEDWRGARQAKVMPVRQTTAVNTNTVPRQPFVSTSYARAAAAQTRPQPTAANGDWMWDPSHHTALDRPVSDTLASPGYYRDPTGRRYWIDNRGYRHYEGSGSPP
jgi:hypothetical protein